MKRKHKTKQLQRPNTNPFDNPHNKYFAQANAVLAIMTIISVAAVAIETVESFQTYHWIFNTIEWVAVGTLLS
jgi:hypothetical protein